jgi:DNA-binding beta-propeller fold protein YncE
MKLLSITAACAVVAAAVAPAVRAADAPPSYRLVKSVPLGAPDRWDYVVFDAPSHRVYVAHGDKVTVVDGRDGKIVGQIEGMPGGTHGIAISAAAGKGYTDDGKAAQAVAFDLKTLKTGARIATVGDADAVTFDAASGHVFVVGGDAGKLGVIDPKTDTQVATVDGGGKLEFAVSDDRGHLYVNGEEKREIVRVDTKSNKVDAHWPMPNCASPHGLAIDKAGHRLFASCVNGLMTVLNTDTGAVVATAPIGKGTDAAAYDPKRKLAFSSNGFDGNITLIQQKTADAYAPAGSVETAISGRTMSLDPATGRLYVAAFEMEPSATPGGRPKPKVGTLRLMFLDPVK